MSDKTKALLLGDDKPIVGPNTALELRRFVAEAEAARPRLPERGEVDELVSGLSLATKERATSKDEARVRLGLYWQALKDVPISDLERGFTELVKTATFMPTPAEVRASALVSKTKRERAISRARHLAWLHDREWTPPIDEADLVKPEDLKALSAQLAEQFPSQRDEDAA